LKAIILAGGPSKQLGVIMGNNMFSRSLVKLPGGTLLDRLLKEAAKLYDDIYVVSDDPAVASYCGSLSRCKYVEQRTKGIEGAICDGLAALKSSGYVTIIYGDIYASSGFVETHAARFINMYEPLVTVTKPLLLRGTYLRLEVDPIELRVVGVGDGQYIFAGIATLPVSLVEETICRNQSGIEKLFARLVEQSKLAAVIWIGEWLDLDTPWDYLVATRFELEKMRGMRVASDASIGRGVIIEGPAVIEHGVRIDHYAVIKGPVYIGPRVFIGAHSFVRGGTAIHDGALVGAYSEVKRSVLCEKAYISSHSYIADSVVGCGAKVAPYTVTLNTPYEGATGEILIMSTRPLEGLKVGAVIEAGAETKAQETIPPATIYRRGS